jgi:diamine N-acetyltransferase
MTIRKATVADLPLLVTLSQTVQRQHADAHPELFRQNPPTEEAAAAFQKMMESPNGYWLIAEEKIACGYLYAYFLERKESWVTSACKVCTIHHVSVEPSFRRRGIARALVAALKDEAVSRGYDRIELDVWSFNSTAKECFARLGFRVFNELMELTDKRPNKALEPTPTAVTPHAMEMKSEGKNWISESNEARVVPAAVVAHL